MPISHPSGKMKNMNISEYNNLKKQANNKYQESIILAEKERFETLKAIDQIWDSLQESRAESSNSNPQISVKAITSHKTKPTIYGELTRSVINTLDEITKNFTKNHIKSALGKSVYCSDSSLSGCLIRLQKKGLIEITKRGKGSTPTKYRRKQIE